LNTISLEKLTEEISQLLLRDKYMLVTAESCTGGGVAAAITDLAGSSQWFERGFVTYSNSAKQELLGVKTITLECYGAVSEETAQEMAEGALRHSHAQVSVAVTGIAGPSGGTATKPIGMVCFAWSIIDQKTVSTTKYFTGDRRAIREQAAVHVVEQLLALLRAK
jgi:nicotinamide-nucleotide amidase